MKSMLVLWLHFWGVSFVCDIQGCLWFLFVGHIVHKCSQVLTSAHKLKSWTYFSCLIRQSSLSEVKLHVLHCNVLQSFSTLVDSLETLASRVRRSKEAVSPRFSGRMWVAWLGGATLVRLGTEEDFTWDLEGEDDEDGEDGGDEDGRNVETGLQVVLWSHGWAWKAPPWSGKGQRWILPEIWNLRIVRS